MRSIGTPNRTVALLCWSCAISNDFSEGLANMDQVACSFIPISEETPTRYRCEICGFTTHTELLKPPKKNCKGGKRQSSRHDAKQATCIHLGDLTASVPSDSVSCGCGVRVLQFYECKHFKEPVLKHRVQPKHETIDEFVRITSQFAKEFTGRSCHGCKASRLIE